MITKQEHLNTNTTTKKEKEDYSEDPDEVSTDVEKESKREVYPYFVYVFFVSFSGPVRVVAGLL